MNQYTIYCTGAQTKRALEIDAPVKQVFYSVHFRETIEQYHLIKIGCKLYEIPTAEQLIGWLEEQDTYINICWERCIYYVQIRSVNKGYLGIGDTTFTSRKEATLAAIDAALEYLTKNKTCTS